MGQYIDKAAVVAEIERLIERAKAERVLYPKTILAAKNYLLIEDYNKLLSFLDTIQAKEVNFEKMWKEYFKYRGDIATVNVKHLAKHFFELGMSVSNKAQKGEKI